MEWTCLAAISLAFTIQFSQSNPSEDEVQELCHHTAVLPRPTLIPLNRYSSFTHLIRITSWILRFVNNCRAGMEERIKMTSFLTTEELRSAENYWIKVVQEDYFAEEMKIIKQSCTVPSSSCLHPFLDSSNALRVGGRESKSQHPYCSRHPAILHGRHPLTTLLIPSEHMRLLHTGPTLLTASLIYRIHIVGCRKAVHSVGDI